MLPTLHYYEPYGHEGTDEHWKCLESRLESGFGLKGCRSGKHEAAI